MRRIMIGILLVVAGGAASQAQRPSTDWTQWRGPNRDGTIASFTPPAAWPDALRNSRRVVFFFMAKSSDGCRVDGAGLGTVAVRIASARAWGNLG